MVQVVTCLHPWHSAGSTKSWAQNMNFRPTPTQQNFISVLVLTYLPLMRQMNFCWLYPSCSRLGRAGFCRTAAQQCLPATLEAGWLRLGKWLPTPAVTMCLSGVSQPVFPGGSTRSFRRSSRLSPAQHSCRGGLFHLNFEFSRLFGRKMFPSV